MFYDMSTYLQPDGPPCPTYLNPVCAWRNYVEGELFGWHDGVEGDVVVRVDPDVRDEVPGAFVHYVWL